MERISDVVQELQIRSGVKSFIELEVIGKLMEDKVIGEALKTLPLEKRQKIINETISSLEFQSALNIELSAIL